MKKIYSILLIVLLCLAVCLSMTSCFGDEDDTTTADSTPTTDAPTEAPTTAKPGDNTPTTEKPHDPSIEDPGDTTTTEPPVDETTNPPYWDDPYYTGDDLATSAPEACEKHYEMTIPAVEPSCYVEGLTEGKMCIICHVITQEQKVIPASHTLKRTLGLAATCTSTGLTDGQKCTICSMVTIEQQVTQALGHDCKTGNTCDRCKKTIPFSNGMVYELNADKSSYTLVDVGTCKDTHIFIPNNYNGLPVTAIGDEAFYWKGFITEITIPNTVVSIGKNAFSDCESLTKINIGTGTTSIGENAFLYCTSLNSLIIPDAVKTIGGTPFAGCTSLTELIVTSNNNSFTSKEGNIYTKDGKTLVSYAPGKVNTSFTVPSTVTAIGDGAFYSCKALTEITIPDSVTSIGALAFSNCDALTKITLGNGVKTIGDSAFASCDSIKTINIPSSVTSIGEKAFYFCDSLTTITVPSSVTLIGNRAFTNCSSLTAIEVASGNSAYKSVEGNLYTKDGKTLIAYAIGKDAASFVIPSDVKTIGDEAFSRCYSLKTITIPSGVTKIGDSAFFYSGIKAVSIPDTVTSIGDSAFADCDALKTVSIGSGVTSIGEDAFVNCIALSMYEVSGSNTAYKSINGDLYSKDGKTFISYASGKKNESLVIPEGVTSISDKAFSSCYYLINITLPDSLTFIGDDAFKGCGALKEVTFTNTAGWFVTTDKNAQSGISVDVNDIGINARDLKGRLSSFYWKRK